MTAEGNSISNILGVGVVLSVFVIIVIYVIAYKKGIDLSSGKCVISIGLGCLIVFCILPLWLTNMPIYLKIIITIASVAAGISNFFVVDKVSKFISKNSKK
jgi:hypothetical protein